MLIRFRSCVNSLTESGALGFSSKTAATKAFNAVWRFKTRREKTAAPSKNDATPNASEIQMVGQSLTEKDLESMQKVLTLLYNLFNEYQMQGGGGGPGAAMAAQAAGGVMPTATLMPPNPMPTQ